jgi:MFS family permease
MRRWGTVVLLCLGVMVAYFDRVNLSVALVVPEFKAFFGLSDADRGLLNSAFFWTYAVLQIPAGFLVDRFGAKWTLGIGFLLWSTVSALTGFAHSFWYLFFARLVLGLGESVTTPAAVAWIRHNYAESQRGLVTGLFMAAAKVGPALGVPLASFLIAGYGWRGMFFLLGGVSLIWVIPWFTLVRDDRPRGGRPTAASTLAAPTDSPSVPFRLVLKSPAIWGILVGTFSYQYFVYFSMTWFPAYLTESRNLSLTSTSWYTGFSFGGMAIVATAAGWAADRLIGRGRDPIRVRKSFIIAGLLVASTQLIGALTASREAAIFFAIFSLSGLGLMTANYWALTQTIIPGAAVGRIVGVQNCAANVAGIVAAMLTGWLKEVTGSYRAPMIVIGVFLLVGISSYLLLVRPRYAPRLSVAAHR